MKAWLNKFKERYQQARDAMEVEPEVRPYITWQGIRDGVLGYTCKTDAEIMRNVGSVNRLRLAEIVKQNNRKAWFVALPLVAVVGFAGYKAITTNPSGAIEIRPVGSLFAAREVSQAEIANLHASIRSTMAARISGDYSNSIQNGLTTRYPNWNQPEITAADFDAALRVPPEAQQAIADRCATKIATGYPCSSSESILYRFLKFEDGVSAKSAEEAREVFLTSGADLLKAYLLDSKFKDICQASHSEKVFFSSMPHADAVSLITSIQSTWVNGEKLPAGVVQATTKSELVKASSLSGCDFQSAMILDVDKGPFKHLVQVYYRPQGLAVEGIWLGLAESSGQREIRVMGCSKESCFAQFGLNEMDYKRSGKAVDFLTSITSEGK